MPTIISLCFFLAALVGLVLASHSAEIFEDDFEQSAVSEQRLLIPLTDTGITACGDAITNNQPCPISGFPSQDAEHGRDVEENLNSDGYAGFSYVKLDAQGHALPVQATDWSCVKDNVTGLVWEVKKDDYELHSRHAYYSWYNTDAATNGGNSGAQNYGSTRCSITNCNSQEFVQAVNGEALCGFVDWRVPTLFELRTLVNHGYAAPSIDTEFFPSTQNDWYWSSSPSAIDAKDAWLMYFGNAGGDGYGPKAFGRRLRLVRSGTKGAIIR